MCVLLCALALLRAVESVGAADCIAAVGYIVEQVVAADVAGAISVEFVVAG